MDNIQLGVDMDPQSAAEMKKLNLEANRFAKFMNKGKDAVIGFNGAALSTLFFGMELERIFISAIKSLVEGYKKIIPESHKFNQMTTKLVANWEFFKFQLADALSNSKTFEVFIQKSIGLLKAFQDLSPAMKVLIVNSMIFLGVLGGIMKYMAILRLGMAGLSDGMKLFSTETGKFAWGKMGKVGIILAVIAAVAGLVKLMTNFYTETDTGKKAWEKFSSGMKKTIASVIEPIQEGLASMGIEIKDVTEFFIYFGAVVHNVFVTIGIVVNAFVVVVRTLFNIISIVFRTVYKFNEALYALLSFDLDGAKDAWHDWKRGVTTDINDVADAMKRGAAAQAEMMDSYVNKSDIDAEISMYRQQSALSSMGQSGGDTNNYIMIDGAVASTTMSSEEQDALKALLGSSVVVGGGY